jgi:hypothetical protein
MWIPRHLLGFDTSSTQQRRKPDVDLRAWVLKQTLSRHACPLLVPMEAHVLTEIYWCVTGDVPVDILHASAFVDVEVFPDSCTSLARAHCFYTMTITFAALHLDVNTFA